MGPQGVPSVPTGLPISLPPKKVDRYREEEATEQLRVRRKMKSLRPPQGKWARPREERGREGRGEDVGGSWGLCPPLALPLTSLLSEPHQAPLPPWAFADPHTHRSPPSGPCALRAADGQCISAAGGRRWRGRARARRSQRPRPLGTKGCLPLPTLPTGSGPGPHVQAHTAPAEHLDGPTHPGAADLLPVR